MRIVIYLVLFLMVAAIRVCPQSPLQPARDSLNDLLKQSKEDTSKVMMLLGLADTYETNNQDSSLYYLEKAKELSDQLKFTPGIYKYYERITIVSFTKGEYQKAIQYGEEALKLARQLHNIAYELKMLGNLGVVFQYTGEFDKQLKYSLQAMALKEKTDQKKDISSLYHNVANAYYNLKQFRKSIEYCFQSLDFHKKFGGNGYLGRIYSSLGQSYYELNSLDSALHFYKIAVEESKKTGDLYAEAGIYGFMADIYAARSDFGSMRTISYASLNLSRQLQSSQMLASSLYNVAFAEYFNNNNDEARKNILEAIKIGEKDSLKDELKNSYTILSYIAAKSGDYSTSLLAKSRADSVQDIFINESIVRNSTEIEKKYESEKKDNQIKLQKAQLERRNIVNWILIGSAITLLIISLLVYRNYKQKQKLQQQRINELETERKLTATDAVLKGEEQERTRLARDLHDGLGGMLSGIKYSLNSMKGNLIMTPDNAEAFERSIGMLDSSIGEMRRVAHNMMPEALVKFGLDTALKDFCNDINRSGALKVNYQSIRMEGALEQTTAITIYRIVQELLNNVIKHAAAKNAIVQVSKTNGMISITVEDDGRGFDTAILRAVQGIGWQNIQSRVEYLKGKLDVQSSPDKGTSVLVEINVADFKTYT
jgi:two-component system NarL family sensor kinase